MVRIVDGFGYSMVYLSIKVRLWKFCTDDPSLGNTGLKNGTVGAYFSGDWEYQGLYEALGENEGVPASIIAAAQNATMATSSVALPSISEMSNYWGPMEIFGNAVVNGTWRRLVILAAAFFKFLKVC